jgi:homoserine O-acetyltransferase/O-succinyltransferase
VLVQKHIFYTPKLELEIGESIPATVGYETYGQLSPARDNAVLVCHHFSGTSHAAGRYHADDPNPGWWDALIGPGKAFDTNRYFVVAVDTLCNLNVRHPLVITTGPSTVNPTTGRAYGPSFPQVTIRDNVRLQHQLVRTLGIDRLACVTGPSMGGFQALEWSVTYPQMVKKVVAAISSDKAPPVFSLAVCQAGIDAIMADPGYNGGDYYGTDGPVDGLTRAVSLLNTLTRSDAWIAGNWERKTAVGSPHPRSASDGRFAFQAETEKAAHERAQDYDANHYIYTARACILQDLGYGNHGLEVAAQKIRAEVLMLPVISDLLFPPEASQSLVEQINLHGGRAELVPIESPNGHTAALFESNRLAEPITRFLSRGDLH